MISAKELQLGDWVLYHGKPARVRNIHDNVLIDGDDEQVDLVFSDRTTMPQVDPIHLEPIPITAEILGKNKFSKSRLMGEQRHFTYYLAPSVSLLAIYDAEFSLHIGDCARYIKYIHQLQHVLRICGIEKEIEL